MENTTPELQQYINNLIPVVKQAVLSPEWKKRVGEIGQKYSLHLDQIGSLETEVLLVIVGMEPEEDLIENIKRELSISNILATQITEDVNTRVFQYIFKLMQNTEIPQSDKFVQQLPVQPPKKIESTPTTPAQNEPLLSAMESKVMSSESRDMKGGVTNNSYTILHNPNHKEVPPPMNLPGIEEEVGGVMSNEVRDVKETEKTVPPPVKPHTSNLTPQPTLADIKLGGLVSSPTEKQVAQTPPTHSYTADPYREPLE